MKHFAFFVIVLMSFSLAACGGGSGGGFVVVEEFSDCPLCKAAKDGDLERVRFLLDSGENPNAVSQSVNANPQATDSIVGDSALRFAVFAERADIVKALLEGGADVNKANKDGATPLSASTNHSSAEIALILLGAGANPDAADIEGWTALMFTAEQSVAKALLNAGANPNMVNKEGLTALMFAAGKGNLEVAKVLLDTGANLNVMDIEGWTALMFVAEQGNPEIAKVLLNAGANPNMAENKGWTALMLALANEHSKVAKVLLNASANPNMANQDGMTALMLAAEKGNSEIAKALLNAGANPNAKEKDGWTAVNAAASIGNAEIAKMLLECGASPDIRNNEDTNAWHWANRQPILHAIFYKHLAEVKAGKDIKPCLQKEVAAAPPPPKGENIAEKVFENAWRSVVVVKSGGRQGSGVIVRPNAVATNCHVIDGGDIVVHKTGDRRALTDSAFAASVRRRDTERDFCLLDVAGLWGIPAGIRAYGSLKVGEDVYALGAPQGLDLSLSAGVISQLRQGRAVRYIQTDAAISPGSSGGGLFDSNANLIGILTAKIASENVEGIGFAIPADLATTP